MEEDLKMIRAAMLVVLVAVTARAGEGPLVFLSSEIPAQGSEYASEVLSVSKITEDFEKRCPSCSVTIKREAADYVVVFADSTKGWSWVVYENQTGRKVKQGVPLLFKNAVKDAVAALLEHHGKLKP